MSHTHAHTNTCTQHRFAHTSHACMSTGVYTHAHHTQSHVHAHGMHTTKQYTHTCLQVQTHACTNTCAHSTRAVTRRHTRTHMHTLITVTSSRDPTQLCLCLTNLPPLTPAGFDPPSCRLWHPLHTRPQSPEGDPLPPRAAMELLPTRGLNVHPARRANTELHSQGENWVEIIITQHTRLLLYRYL